MLNIEYIGSKIKKSRKHDLTGLLKKLIRLPKAKRAKGKKYYEEGYRVNTQMYNTLELNWSLRV